MTTCRYINSGLSNFEYEYLGEFETEFKNILGHESRAELCSFDGKKQRSKISCYCPFKVLIWILEARSNCPDVKSLPFHRNLAGVLL